MSNEPGTAIALLAEYDARKFNVLAPIVNVVEGAASSPYLVESVAMLQISPHPMANETYHDFRYANERDKKHALTSLALAKIASAAGIKWIPELCKPIARERLDDGHLYVAFQAGAGVRQPNGEWHIETAVKEIDTADEAERLDDAYRRKLDAGRAKYSAEQIPEMVRRDILQLKEHAMAQAETKAKSRAIRRILALKQVYTEEELARPFVVPRLLYRPDLADPLALEQVQVEGRRATAELYGELPSSTEHGESAASGIGSLRAEPSPDDVPPGGTEEAPKDARSGAASAGGSSGKGKAPAPHDTSTGAGVPERPKVDPVVEQGPYAGKHFSELAEHHPDALRGMIAATRAKGKREILESWLAYYQPTLGGA